MTIARWTIPILALALAAPLPGAARAQDAKPDQDNALDALIEKLGEPATRDQKAQDSTAKDSKAKPPNAQKPDSAGKKGEGAKGEGAKGEGAKGEGAKGDGAKGEGAKGDGAKGEGATKPGADPPQGAPGQVPAGDQELDSLLEKLGETKDAPQTDQSKPPGGAPAGRDQPPPGEKPKPDAVGGKDQEIDRRLEEYTGRKRKRKDDQERSGAVGEMIKEMREVEKRLGQPDTSEPTRARQKQIVKRIDQMIEQARKSGSMQRQITMRKVRQAGGQQGQDGDQPGAQAKGAQASKPARPPTTHSKAGGKDVWGHLPAELRQAMENTWKETDLPAKAEIISRYFLSVGKGRLNRED